MTADVARQPAGQFPSTIKPFTAMVAMVKFLINKEDTSQVFRVFDAIDGPQTERNFRRFEKLPEGKRIIEREIDLAPILRDRERLARLPANTLGGAYYAFTQAEGLNADGLVYAEQAANVRTLQVEPARRRFISSGFQLHDIWHVLGGFGRDAVGEACVLAFSYGQLDIIGMDIFAKMMAVKEKLYYPKAPVFACLREARDMGRKAEWLVAQDWDALLDQDLREVRFKLRVGTPTLYNQYKDQFAETDARRREKMLKDAA